MKTTYLGNHSWFFESGQSKILIDPVLLDGFGTNETQFVISPQRKVLNAQAPEATDVVLTTEHLQHFQPRSFKLLSTLKPLPTIHVSVLFPSCAIDPLKKMGFKIVRHFDGIKYSTSDIDFWFFSNPEENLKWDIRVSSVYLTSKKEAFVVQSDCKPSQKLCDFLNSESPLLTAVITTNNSSALDPTSVCGLNNILPVRRGVKSASLGSSLMIDLLVKTFEDFPYIPNIIISGGGYVDTENVMQPSRWSNVVIAKYANELSLGTQVLAPKPGQKFTFKTQKLVASTIVNWIKPVSFYEVCSETPDHQSWNMRCISNKILPENGLQECKESLSKMSKSLLLSNFGKALMKVDNYLGRDLGSSRFVVQLLSWNSVSKQYVFDLQIANFKEIDWTGDLALRQFPFGIRIVTEDFFALINGQIQIWEMSMISARSWYICDKFSSPMAFFYEYFDEGVSQELAKKSYQNELSLLE